MAHFRTLFLALFVVLGVETVSGEEPARIPLWAGLPPGETAGPDAEMAQPNRPGEDPPVIRLTNVSRPELAVFPAPETTRTGTAVIICPGGGYNILAWNKEGTEVAAWLNSVGVTAFVLKYRTPTAKRDEPWRAPAQDAQRALRMVRSRASEWGLKSDRIGLMGFSAGGSAATNASLKCDTPLYEPRDAVDEVSCRPDFTLLIYPAYLVDGQGQLKPDLAVTANTPPMFLVHAFNDGVTCESSLQLFLALKKKGVASELHIYATGGHGFGLRPGPEVISTWPQRCAEWMRARGLLDAGSR